MNAWIDYCWRSTACDSEVDVLVQRLGEIHCKVGSWSSLRSNIYSLYLVYGILWNGGALWAHMNKTKGHTARSTMYMRDFLYFLGMFMSDRSSCCSFVDGKTHHNTRENEYIETCERGGHNYPRSRSARYTLYNYIYPIPVIVLTGPQRRSLILARGRLVRGNSAMRAPCYGQCPDDRRPRLYSGIVITTAVDAPHIHDRYKNNTYRR